MIDFAAYGVEEHVASAMSMDRRHVEWVRECLRRLRPVVYVEIGACYGVSTTAGIEAVRAGDVEWFHAVDVRLQPTVRAMAEGVPGVTLHEGRSVDVLPSLAVARPIAVLIDGDHTLAGVRPELERVLALRPMTIFAHDVTAEAAGYKDCDGSAWLWHELQRLGWRCVVDAIRRPGQATHRGLLVATLWREDYISAITQAWVHTCGPQ